MVTALSVLRNRLTTPNMAAIIKSPIEQVLVSTSKLRKGTLFLEAKMVALRGAATQNSLAWLMSTYF